MSEGAKIDKAIQKAAALMLANGLKDWKIDINNKRSSLAETYYGSRTITFSKHFIMASTEEQFIGVTFHEITHALLGRGHGHNETFKKLCAEISPNADYARASVEMPIRKYLLECPKCGYQGSTNIKKDRYCGACWRNNKDMVVFTKRENILEVKAW